MMESSGLGLMFLCFLTVVLCYIWEETIVRVFFRDLLVYRLSLHDGCGRCLIALTISPFCEEIIFRATPFFTTLYSDSFTVVIGVSTLSSIVFGLCHGGAKHILIEGPMGFLLSLLFFRVVGYRAAIDNDVSGGTFLSALVVVMLTHSAYNTLWILSNSVQRNKSYS